jgi:glycosyltransferase involved in cell wall biosynthesis
MRITYVIPYFAPAWAYGGPPRLAYDLARQLVAAGHCVNVLTTDALDERRRARPRRESMQGIQVERLPNVSNRLAWRYKLFFPRGFGPAFRRALDKCDVVHLFDFRDYQNAVGLTNLQRRGVPFVVSALGELSRASGVKRPIKLAFDVMFGYRILGSAAALLAQTPEEAGWYVRLGAPAHRIKILPLAIDVDALPRDRQRGAFRSRFGIGPDETVILFLGRIHAYKGVELLIRAFARLRARRDNLRLVIAGRDDGFLASAQKLAREVAPAGSIVFSGPVYGDQRFQAYRDADVFAITPSHAEQTSLAALEAAACGTPLLVSEQSPVPGLESAAAGVTVAHDLDSVASGLDYLLDADRAPMGLNAARLVREHFSLARVARQLEDIYSAARCGMTSGE